MKFVLFLMLVLMIGGAVYLYYREEKPDVPQSVTYVTVEADKRKSVGAKIAGYGFDVKW